MKEKTKNLAYFGMFVASVLVFFGVYRAFTRGASDFNVFYGSWNLVLQGRFDQIYRITSDRYLYSPSFAWLLSPFAFFSHHWSLAIWCGLKVLTLIFIFRKFQSYLSSDKSLAVFAMVSASVLLVIRPVLIDLEYGQVNLFILGACFWALTGHFEKKCSYFLDGIRWAGLSFVAIAKLFPLPLLLVPFFVTQGVPSKKLKAERMGVLFSSLVIGTLPLVVLGWKSGIALYLDWQKALIDRGFPTESHNQSFTAFLYRYLSGEPTWVRSEGMQPLYLGIKWLSQETIRLLSLSWLFVFMGWFCGLIISGPKKNQFLAWTSLLIGMSVVPSHLVWKPYFVMSLPLAMLLFWSSVLSKNKIDLLLISIVFFGMNLSGFDFIGHHWASYLESASILLLIHLILLVRVRELMLSQKINSL
jgi:hypothetical protein